MNSKVTKGKNDSVFGNGDSKVPTNVNSLRKLFESNFKFSNITKPFKSKNNNTGHKSVDVPKNVLFQENPSRRFPKFSDGKENRSECEFTRATSPAGCFLNCKIENCCCKTFFGQYNETPIFRYRPLPKLPLQERNDNSRFDRHRPERWSAASCSSYNLSKQQQQLNLSHHLDTSLHDSLNHNSNSSCHRPERWSAASCSNYNLGKQKQRQLNVSQHPETLIHDAQNHKSDSSRNKFYSINYAFYKSKSQEIFDETPVSAVSTKRIVSRTGSSVNLLEKITNSENEDDVDRCSSHNENSSSALTFHKTEATSFVNFTAAPSNEGGYMKSAEDFQLVRQVSDDLGDRENSGPSRWKTKLQKMTGEPRTLLQKDSDEKPVEGDPEAHRIGGFGFKCRLPKLKNMGLRENSHPYNVKKPRLTVKGVKNRNMRNVKRRQKLTETSTLGRSQTFSGYDNFAYRRSVTDQQLSKPREETDSEANFPVDGSIGAAKSTADRDVISGKSFDAVVRGPRPASISVIGLNDGPQFHLDSRMTCYDWPVTSFYIEPCEKQSLKASRRSSSSFDLNAKPSSHEKNVNPLARKTNLKRHCSLGYLEEEFFEYNFTRHRRSVENVDKASATCDIQSIPEVNKIINTRKFQNLDVHVHALFAAVEHGNVEKTKTILESSNVNVNSVNSDGLSPLDVALLSNNKSLVKLLVTYGAQEGRKFFGADLRNHLYNFLHEAESRVQELSGSLRLNMDTDQSSMSTLSSSIPSVTIGDSAQNKTFSIWERRAKGLKRMLTGFEQIRPPDPPSVVTVEVASTSSITVYFTESNNENSSMTTKFKVQLSTDEDFLCLCGHYEVADTRQLKYHIKNLCKGQTYYVRVASGNIIGYSAYKLSTPPFIVPSSWRDVAKKDFRFSDSLKDTLDGIFTRVVVDHPYLRHNAELFGEGAELFVNQRRKKTTIKQLFAVSSKFQKHLKRGVYLACLLYHEDKVLVTNEDFLPVIEIDENYPRKIHNDFHWFYKVACNWNDLKWMKNDMEKLQNSSAVFRIKLVQAAAHMQTALNIQELGKIYYKMLRDVEGTIVISVINYIHSPKSVSVFNLRWLPLAKLNKRVNLVNFLHSNLSDVLIASIPEQITYHQVSKIKLPRGLYLSYLKMRTSVDSLQVLVPFRTPNIPPHCKIRDNPHVTAEEWEWLVEKENLKESLVSATYQQRLFIEQVVVTARRLFTHMDIPDEEAASHRLYDAEVIEVNKDVSLIMIVPSAEVSCSMPDQREVLLQRPHLLPLTVQAFEIVHFENYRIELISLYARLSCVIEMDIDVAQHNLRQAFNDLEVDSARNKLHELETLQAQLNTAWKKSKWLLDIVSFARDRFSVPRVSMRQLLSVHSKRALASAESNRHVQSPNVKTAKSRGSWPDASAGRHLSRMPSEISRSEQHLTSDVVSAISTKTPTIKTALPLKRTESKEIMAVSHSSSTSGTEPRNCLQSKKYTSQSITDSGSSNSIHSVSSDELSASSSKGTRNPDSNVTDAVHVPASNPVIIKIYAAYDTGLDSQIHFKFHVSPRTTARDIVDMFVKQTNMSIILKGKERPIYSDTELSNFCLVAVDGTHERSLRDDFRLSQFQRLWKDGRLYVRRRSSLLATSESDSQSSYV